MIYLQKQKIFHQVLLRFFRINDPYRLVGLLILLIILALPFLIDHPPLTIPEIRSFVLGEAVMEGRPMYTQVIDYTAPLTTSVFGIADWIFGRSVTARQIIALILIFFQASYFAILLISNKAYNDSTYVPAVIFAILCFFSFDLLSLSPELMGSTVLLFALNYLFREIEFRSERDEIILSLGVCLGIATLVVFSYIIFLFVTVLMLFVYTRPSVRKVLLLLFGFVLPHALLLTLYYFRGEVASLWHGFYQANFSIHDSVWIPFRGMLVLSAVPLAYFVFSLFMLNREARFTKYQSQLFQAMVFWMLAGLIQITVTHDLSPHSFIIFIPGLTYFISHYLILIRRKWIGELMLWIFLISIVTISLIARYGHFSSIRYDSLFVKPSIYSAQVSKKRVMVVSGDEGIYERNTMAGFFLDWRLSREVLEHPEFYENVILVDNAMRSYPPEVILDPANNMKGYFDRLPFLQSHYRREGDLWHKIN